VLLDCFAIAAGVACIVLAVAVNHGSYMTARGPGYGLDRRVVVVTGTATSASGVENGLTTSSLTSSDVTALANAALVSDAVAVAPTAGVRTQVSALSRTTLTDVIGTTQTFADVLGYSVSAGRFITPGDVATTAPVVVLGQSVVNSLFSGVAPVGQSVVIDNHTFQVIGTFAPKGYSGTYDQDNLVVMPITTAWQELTGLGSSPIDQVLIRASSPAKAPAVAREATAVLLNRHGVVDPALADFTVHRQSDVLIAEVQAAEAVRRLLEAAAIALLVAGSIQVATASRFRLVTTGRPPVPGGDPMERLVAAVSVGLAGAAIGVVAALVLSPSVHRLAAEVPVAHVTVYGIAAGAALGVLAAALPAIPGVLRGRRHQPPPTAVNSEDQSRVPVG
jgi:putative ABC transport system permease protein